MTNPLRQWVKGPPSCMFDSHCCIAPASSTGPSPLRHLPCPPSQMRSRYRRRRRRLWGFSLPTHCSWMLRGALGTSLFGIHIFNKHQGGRAAGRLVPHQSWPSGSLPFESPGLCRAHQSALLHAQPCSVFSYLDSSCSLDLLCDVIDYSPFFPRLTGNLT